MSSDEERRRIEAIRARTVARPLWDEDDRAPNDEAADGFSYEEDAVPSSAGTLPEELTDGQKRAIATAMNILAFADNTERRLREKLARKGYKPDEVEAGVAYVVGMGYLREDRMLEKATEYLAEKKLYGRRRICVELIKKGFTRDAVTSVDFGVFDFPALCAVRIRTLLRLEDDPIPDFSLEEKQKAALIRAGYGYGEITAAAEIIRRGEQ